MKSLKPFVSVLSSMATKTVLHVNWAHSSSGIHLHKKWCIHRFGMSVKEQLPIRICTRRYGGNQVNPPIFHPRSYIQRTLIKLGECDFLSYCFVFQCTTTERYVSSGHSNAVTSSDFFFRCIIMLNNRWFMTRVFIPFLYIYIYHIFGSKYSRICFRQVGHHNTI